MISYFSAHCDLWVVRKLDVGDYMWEDGAVTIDRKEDLGELSKNLTNAADRARFMDEIRRARTQGLHLVVLCEHGHGIKRIPDIAGWSSRYTPVTGRALMERIYKVHVSYGVDFVFCETRETPRKILEILSKKYENIY